MKADDLQEIEIPQQRGGRPIGSLGVLSRALLAAHQNGRAIRVPVNGSSWRALRNRLLARQRAWSKQGFRVATSVAADGQSVAAWLVPIAPKP